MKFETRREQAMRLKRQKQSAVAGLALAFLLVVVVGIVVWNGKLTLAKRNAEYQEQIIQLQAEVDEQKARTVELEEYKKYIQTKKFVEETAKDKFGLIYPDELVFKPKK